ncbi:MAG: bifunctional tRNA (5-methylaminomethyl-2-thiouridine)(34)-methyltransferase MnmD/FAD-dependent 5-carboxymethylaminomethyl-2-thiouridine(34) oxidoreductase MnmC [Gammaproteobacteria bacterium]|nr:bifunctional tRNA (5-methylaminomethyl-2-thiouridine)(34)-methyltransferase MnmD/FAD-dependent 5-carboxymethylaminomethyl-2-thiouridine(34) oxidoreductase MnmC [Gammaproteobacteria bacterium]
MLTAQTPQLNFNSDGIPCSELFGDPYFSLTNPLEESQHVFLSSTNIVQRWKNTQFTIAELGFGFGINFITTFNEWREHYSSEQHLHYISFERYPVQPADLAQCYKQLNIPSALTDYLLEHYPLPIKGFHRIEFNQYKLTLTLVFGEALACLKECNFVADAWFLDGFAPSKNKTLWSNEIANQLNRLTCNGGTLSTYSAASEVRKTFTKAGFNIEKKPGYGKKREMLVGTLINKTISNKHTLKDKSWLISHSAITKNKHALVIGAGMTGTAISSALAKRGWQVTMVDKNSTLASEASGNDNAILMPRLSADHNIQSQLTLLGFLYSLHYLNNLEKFLNTFRWHQCGAIQIPRDDAQWKRMQLIASQENIPPKLFQAVNQQQASELANCTIDRDGWYLPLAGWVSPIELCAALTEQYTDNISFRANTEICSIEKNDSQWIAYNPEQEECSADIVIIANAMAANQFSQTSWCQLHPKRGQISLIPKRDCNIQPSRIVCADAYITPTINSHYVVGATFITADTSTDIRQSEHKENMLKISKMIPSYHFNELQSLGGRAGIRAVSTDRLPIVGPVADEDKFNAMYHDAAQGSTHHKYPTPLYHEGLYLASGFGSRGLAWIPLCTEALACLINNEPSPLSNELLNAIHPNRILMKNLVKRVQSES